MPDRRPAGHAAGRRSWRCLGKEVDAIRLAERRVSHVEAGEDAGDQQRRDALSVRRTLQDLMVAIVGADRLDIFRSGTCQIFKLHHSSHRLQCCDDVFGDGTFVKRGASLARNPAQRRAERGMVELAADGGRSATGQIDRYTGPVSFDAIGVACPIQRGAGRHHKAGFGGADRRRQNLVEAF